MICVNSVSVYPKSISLKVGTWSYAAYAEVCPSNADCKEVQWHSDNPSVASVNASSGYICANGVGTAHIYATATDGSGCSDYLTVTVSNTVPVTSVTLNRSSLSLEEGHSASLSATVCPDNATNKNINWESSNNSVATVSNGVVTAIATGTARITATAADGSGHHDCCSVIVTKDVMVTNVSITPSSTSLNVGESCYLNATITPNDATNKTVYWHSSNPDVATVNPNSGLVTAQNAGTAIIYATALDGSDIAGTCSISVVYVPLVCISIFPKKKTLTKDETITLTASVCPYNANNSVIWTSSDTSVATVGTHTGIVTAKADGTATITARSVDGNKTDTCIITVDSREKVTIKKDDHSFFVEFADGKIWKNIGKDLTNRGENYGSVNPPNFIWQCYDSLITEEQRYFDNIYYNKYESVVTAYSEKQLGFLYLLDPLGVEYYMRNHAYKVTNGALDLLLFKDRVYETIFGSNDRQSGRFYFKIDDGHKWYGQYDDNENFDRWQVYSNAEILFGGHVYFDWNDFIQSGLESIFGNLPIISDILLGVEIYQALFFSSSIVSATSSAASRFLEIYAENSEDTLLNSLFGWPKKLFDCFEIIVSAAAGAFQLNDLNDITIYSKIQEQNYRTFFENYSSVLSIEEILSKCSNS